MRQMAARLPAVLIALFLSHAASVTAQTSAEPIRYALSFPAPHTHYMEVAAAVPTAGRPVVELMMPVWTPGSYLVREFERNVESVTAANPQGRALEVDKSQKNHWRISTGGAQSVTVKYRVYCRELTMRTNWVDEEFALLNGPPTFMTLADQVRRPHEVILNPARGWTRSMTSLPSMGGEHRYRAPDFDTLADSPIVIGNPAVYEFAVDGRTHYLVDIGEAGIFDGARAARDVAKIVEEHRRLWGSLPYEKYLFFNILTETPTGGLEHNNASVLVMNRWSSRTPAAYLEWLSYVSHEHFHAWNVKRLRPVELGPFDYDNEAYTRSLWIAEGVTEYYAQVTLGRAGLATRDDVLDALSNEIESLQTTPGRQVQSAAMASFDAWIKYYRPDENSVNVSISYYTKGVVLGLLLDAKIRKATNGAKSLDDVMRAAYAKFSGPRGYTPEDFRAVAEEVSELNLKMFWDAAVDGTAELDYGEALELFGLRFRPAATSGKAWLGLTTRNDAGRMLISQVRRDTPAFAAGLNVDDEILAVDDFRVRADQLNARLDQYKPGDTVTVLVARRQQLRRLEVKLGTEPPREWRLEVNPASSETQQRQRAAWLQPHA
jgi:predicted metalloprotease with PDZ domain